MLCIVQVCIEEAQYFYVVRSQSIVRSKNIYSAAESIHSPLQCASVLTVDVDVVGAIEVDRRDVSELVSVAVEEAAVFTVELEHVVVAIARQLTTHSHVSDVTQLHAVVDAVRAKTFGALALEVIIATRVIYFRSREPLHD